MRLAGLVNDAEVVLREIERPAGLSPGEVLGRLPILEVVVIRPDLEGFRETFQELLPVF